MRKKLTLWGPKKGIISVTTLKMDKNTFECKVTTAQGTDRFILEEIAGEECSTRDLLGRPFGKNLEHCIYLGAIYCPDFTKKVKAFYRNNEYDPNLEIARVVQPGTIRIDFYGDRKS